MRIWSLVFVLGLGISSNAAAMVTTFDGSPSAGRCRSPIGGINHGGASGILIDYWFTCENFSEDTAVYTLWMTTNVKKAKVYYKIEVQKRNGETQRLSWDFIIQDKTKVYAYGPAISEPSLTLTKAEIVNY